MCFVYIVRVRMERLCVVVLGIVKLFFIYFVVDE